jgi:cytochrome c-type biogenesis protein CcmH/NrfG
MRQAVAADPRDWELWFALAQIASGGESARALAEARRLNPLSPEIRAYVRSLERSE